MAQAGPSFAATEQEQQLVRCEAYLQELKKINELEKTNPVEAEALREKAKKEFATFSSEMKKYCVLLNKCNSYLEKSSEANALEKTNPIEAASLKLEADKELEKFTPEMKNYCLQAQAYKASKVLKTHEKEIATDLKGVRFKDGTSLFKSVSDQKMDEIASEYLKKDHEASKRIDESEKKLKFLQEQIDQLTGSQQSELRALPRAILPQATAQASSRKKQPETAGRPAAAAPQPQRKASVCCIQ